MKTQSLKLQIRILGLVPVLAMAVAQGANAEQNCSSIRTSLNKIEGVRGQTLVGAQIGQPTQPASVDTSGRYFANAFESKDSPSGINPELAKKAAAISFQIFNPYKKDGDKIEQVTGFSGSGFLVGSKCHIVTSLHVVDLSDGEIADLKGKTVEVVHGQSGKIFKAKVLDAGQGGPGDDWAFLKLDGEMEGEIRPAIMTDETPQSLVVSGFPVDMVSSTSLGKKTRPVISGACGVSSKGVFGELNTNCRVFSGNSGGFVGGELSKKGSPVAAGIMIRSDGKKLVADAQGTVGNGTFLPFTREIYNKIMEAGTRDDCSKK